MQSCDTVGQEFGCGTEEPETGFARFRWRNFMAFNARLLQAQVCDPTIHALTAFHEALERREPSPITRDMYVLIAVDWLSLAGDVLFRQTQNQGPRGHGELWKGNWCWCEYR